VNDWTGVKAPGAAWINVTFPGVGAAVIAEIAQNIPRGLMGRPSMPENYGMLFDMIASGNHAFYMKNVLIPLDLIFISQDHVVVGIIRNATPFDETLRAVGVPSRYVLEVNGGWAARHGVTVGQRVD
jgi:uncharacterized protein